MVRTTPLVIATRQSELALWQARHVQQHLQARHPHLSISLLGMTTTGDRTLNTPLYEVGGKGLFLKELEQALLDGRADIAVHSMKDVPMHLADDFMLAAITMREDARDAFVSNTPLADLPAGSIIGTSSLRRQHLLNAHFPHLQIKPVRGNLATRLRRLDEGQYHGIVLAAAGLIRLGLAARICQYLATDSFIPAAGQGALGIEICSQRAQELTPLLQSLHHIPTACCVTAERAMSRALNGDCHMPLGAYAQLINKEIHLRGFIVADGKLASAYLSDSDQYPIALGEKLAQQLLSQASC